ncbi:hypothetical protein [Streptomyces sp. NPDC058548]|uniref:hypothetical protein n=1 Tax=unclassified Streptomyces TaxID=2593676 RepID=UPI003650AD77
MTTVPSPAAGADVAQLQKLLAALTDANPQAYFDTANALDEVAVLLAKVAEQVKERSAALFQGTGGGERWQGEAADTAKAVATDLTAQLRKLSGAVGPWGTEADSAGEAINNAWREVNDILTNAGRL